MCAGCGLIRLSPRPAPSFVRDHHKQDGYDPFLSFTTPHNLTERIYLSARRWTARWKHNLIKRILPNGGNVLDIGCGTGEFLAAISDLADVQGVEPEPEAARYGRERLGLNIHTGDLDSVVLPAGKFRLVTMWHAIEHMPQPVEALSRVHDLLEPDGRLLIAVPNIGSFDATAYESNWVAVDAPRHLWHFTPAKLDQVAETAGFKLVEQRALPLDLFYNVLLSEQVRSAAGIGWKLIAPFRMGWIIVGSLAKATFKKSPSGMLRIYRRK